MGIFKTIFIIEHDIDPASVKNIIRPDSTDPRTTAAGVSHFIDMLANGSVTASGSAGSGTLGIGFTGTNQDIVDNSTFSAYVNLD